MTAFKALQEQNRYGPGGHITLPTEPFLITVSILSHYSHDAMDSFYDYIWDVTILEYLTRILHVTIITVG